MSIRLKVPDQAARHVGFLGLVLFLSGPNLAAGDDEVLELQRFQVTGSNIKRSDLEGPSPVIVVDKQQIERSGATTVKELFRDVIYNTAGITDETFTQGFAPASAGIDLRGLGVQRTLVLVNGRRLPTFPFGQDGTSSFVDINLIPLGAVERVEILKDGASAIYGSDAVAGVVNIILRRDFEGAELSVDYGQTDQGDGGEGRVTFAGGLSGERSNVTFTLDYLDRNEVMARDRDISASALGAIDDRSNLGNPGTIIRLAKDSLQPDPRCPSGNVDGPFCTFDFAPYVTLIPEVERLGMALSGEYEINDSINLFANAMFTHSDSRRDLAPTGDAFLVAPDNPNNIFPGEPVLSIYRLLEIGSRRDEFETDFYNLVGGLNGVAGDWDWEVGGGWGKVDTTVTGENGYPIYDAVQEQIDNGILDPFGSSPDFNPSSVEHTTERKGSSRLWYVDAKASSEIMEMTHGPLALALGTEYRSEKFSDHMDDLTASGEVLGIGSWDGEGNRDVFAAYAEFSIPLMEDLEMQLAGRYDDYSDFGDTFNPKLGLRWKPMENLLMRGSAGTGFRAPSLQELYSGVTSSPVNESVYDPVTGDVVEVDLYPSGNADLDAEESDTYNLGVVWDVTNAWDLSVDYWYIKNENAITNSAQYYVDNEVLFGDKVEREDGEITTIYSPFQNVAAQKLWGIDLDTNVRWQVDKVGDFHLRVAGAYLGSFEQEPVSGAGFDELAGKDGHPRWRALGSLWWKKAVYDAGLTLNYVGEYTREAADDQVSDWTTVDGQFNWRPPALNGGTVTLGMDNMFDAEPPEDPYLEGWPFFNRALHSARGRFLYARYKHAF